jgi:hypothetical protein
MRINIETFTNPITEEVLQPKKYSNPSIKYEDTLYFNKHIQGNEIDLSYTLQKDFLISSIFLSVNSDTFQNQQSHGEFKIFIDNYPEDLPQNDFFGLYNGIIASGVFSNIKGSEYFPFYFNVPVLVKRGNILVITASNMMANFLHITGMIKGVFND